MLVATHERSGGVQHVHRFKNNYGASVVRHDYSYGSEQGLWEIGVIEFFGEGSDDFELTYDTPITDDVLGYLSDEEVANTLYQIEQL